MRLRDHQNVHVSDEPEATPGGVNAAPDDAQRARANALFSAADEAINRALSGNSDEFLKQSRQMGGQ
jgi:hypothetical protein